MKLKTESIFRIGAGALLAAGILWTAINLLRAGSFFQLSRSKQESIAKLREIKQQNDLVEASFSALASVSNTVPPLSAMVAAAVTGSVAEIRELDSRVMGRGWDAKTVEIKFSEVSLNSIADFLRSAETRRPPWRLAECIIVSSPKADGYGSATLIMETVARQP